MIGINTTTGDRGDEQLGLGGANQGALIALNRATVSGAEAVLPSHGMDDENASIVSEPWSGLDPVESSLVFWVFLVTAWGWLP